MTIEPSRSAATLRAPLASVSALLVVSLFLGVSLNAAKPAVREAARNSASERVAVRELTASLARAVRQLVGSDQHKPGLPSGARFAAIARRDNASPRPASLALKPGVSLLRDALLNLPPPRPA